MDSILLTIALFGWRAGIVAAVSSLGIYAGFGEAIFRGRLTPMHVTNQWWVSEGPGFAMAITVLLVAQASYVQAHRRALERACRAEERLTAAHIRQLQLARDLHDETVQQMYAVLLALRRAITDVQRYPEQSVARLTHALDLSTLAWHGLHDYLQALRQSPQTPKPPLSRPVFSKMADLPDELIPFDAQMTLTRIVQEAMSNVYRYSQATQVRVEIRLESEDIQISIEDNGAGFDPTEANEHSFGLASPRERITVMGGTLTIDSAPSASARLSATIPLEVSSHER